MSAMGYLISILALTPYFPTCIPPGMFWITLQERINFLTIFRKNPLSYSKTALILRSGFTKTHALVVLDGKFDPSHTMRLDLGGNNSTDFLQKV